MTYIRSRDVARNTVPLLRLLIRKFNISEFKEISTMAGEDCTYIFFLERKYKVYPPGQY